MLRISATTLESFRLFCHPENEWMDEARMVASIEGTVEDTPELLAGRAFDDVITTPDRFSVPGGYWSGGHFFPDAMMTPVLALYDRRGVFQVKATRRYGDDCLVVVKADELVGTQVIETKTTKSFDFQKYADSCQWRFYADVFGALRVTYRVFVLDLLAPAAPELLDAPMPTVTLKDTHAFDLYPYADLHVDCAALVERFRDYVVGRGLDALLRERQARADDAAVFA